MMHSENYKALSPAELNQWIEENRSFYLIDTLLEDHFNRIRLPGAVNACVFQVNFMDQIKTITEDRDVPIVFYGSSSRSMDAVTAAGKLHENGFKKIHVLTDGIMGWREARFFENLGMHLVFDLISFQVRIIAH